MSDWLSLLIVVSWPPWFRMKWRLLLSSSGALECSLVWSNQMLDVSLVLWFLCRLTLLLFIGKWANWNMIERRQQMILGHVFIAILLSDSVAYQEALLSWVIQSFTIDFLTIQHTNQLSRLLTSFQHQYELFTKNVRYLASQFKSSSFFLIFSSFIDQ